MRKAFLVHTSLSLLLVAGCSSSSDSGTSTSWQDAFAGVAVSSPVSGTVGTSSFVPALSRNVSAFSLHGDESVKTKITTLTDLASGKAATGCRISFASLSGFAGRANCYGPTINYTNHQDGGGSGSLPGGDLGIWDQTEVSGEACAAAQINQLVKSAANYFDSAMGLQASAICVLTTGGTVIPTSSSSVDFASSFQDVVQEDTPAATITTANMARNSDGSFTLTLEGTTDGAKAFKVVSKVNKTTTQKEGRLYGFFETTNRDAFSASFTKTSNDISMQYYAGTWSLATSESAMFETNGDLKLSGWSGNMNHAVLDYDLSSETGTLSYAWQAGGGDSNTRVFNAYTTKSGSQFDGCGFFGFGDAFSTTLTSNTNSITGFICNWAGPGGNHSMATTTHLAQKQCFSKTTSATFFSPTSSSITYAPTNSCNDTNGSFTYDWPTHSGDGATNDLVDLTSDTSFPSYTAPAGPTLSSGF